MFGRNKSIHTKRQLPTHKQNYKSSDQKNVDKSYVRSIMLYDCETYTLPEKH